MECLVAICTHNRHTLLEQTMASLDALECPPGLRVRVVVVANACTDETEEAVRRWQSPFPVQLLAEPTAGLSHARNRALQYARETAVDVVLWSDDDVEYGRGFLAAYHDAWTANPDSLVFGGRILPRFLPPSPPELEFLRATVGLHPFSCLDFGTEGRDMNPRTGLPFGANMAVRMTPSNRERGFDPRLGVTPRRKVGFEETVYLNDVLAGAPWRYVPNASVHHLLPPRRQSREAVGQYFRALGQYEGFVATDELPDMRMLWGAPRWTWRQRASLLLRFSTAMLLRDRATVLRTQLEQLRLAGYIEAFGERIPPGISELIR